MEPPHLYKVASLCDIDLLNMSVIFVYLIPNLNFLAHFRERNKRVKRNSFLHAPQLMRFWDIHIPSFSVKKEKIGKRGLSPQSSHHVHLSWSHILYYEGWKVPGAIEKFEKGF